MLTRLTDAPLSAVNASLIGLIVGVAKRLRHQDGTILVQQKQAAILAYFTTALLSEKTGVPSHSTVRLAIQSV